MLSEVPEGWIRAKQGDVATFHNGRAYKLKEWESEGTPVIRLQNLTGSGKEFYYSNLKLPPHQYCDSGDLLFMWSASFGAYIWRGGRAIYHYHIWKVEQNERRLLRQFHYYLLQFYTEVWKQGAHGMAMLHLTKKGMEQLEIDVPPLNEQHRVTEILSSVDASIQATQAVIEQAERVKRGLMEELLTGGLGNEAIERGEVPEGWCNVALSEVLEFMRNGFSCKQEKSPLDGYVPVSRIETISTGFIDATRVGYVPYEEKLERYKIEKGDILFSHINSIEHIAKIAFSEEAQSFFHAMNLLLLRADRDKIIPFYLAEVLRWERTRSYFREHCKRAVNQVSLNQKNIGGYEFPLPAAEEQLRIVELLLSADAFIAQQKSVVEQQIRTKRGLMDDLLTGKVRTV